MNKADIRFNLLKKRKAIKNKFIFEKKIFERLKSFNFDKKETISGYISSNSEADILPFLSYLGKKKINICLPFIKKINHHLFFKKWIYNETKLVEGKFNILVPDNNIFIEPTLLLIPLIAFDLKKNRIGYGGGYYDRTISFLEKKKNILTIGVAFDEQQIEKVPTMQYDKKLNYIITQTRIIE